MLLWVQNELGILEFIHALVETMDKYFESVVRFGDTWPRLGGKLD